MYYDADELEKRDNIEVMEEKKKNNYFFAHAIFAYLLRF